MSFSLSVLVITSSKAVLYPSAGFSFYSLPLVCTFYSLPLICTYFTLTLLHASSTDSNISLLHHSNPHSNFLYSMLAVIPLPSFPLSHAHFPPCACASIYSLCTFPGPTGPQHSHVAHPELLSKLMFLAQDAPQYRPCPEITSKCLSPR